MDNSRKDSVLAAVDIVELVGEKVTLRRQGKDFVGLCPFHPDKKPSLSVSPAKQIFKCWSCGVGGDAIKFVQLRERIDFRDALRVLAERVGLNFHASNPRQDQSREDLRATLHWAVEFFQRNLREASGAAAHEYALRRGLSPSTIATHRIGFAPNSWDCLFDGATRAGIKPQLLVDAGLVAVGESGRHYDRFRNRLIFPIFDALGRPVAFGGRTLGDDPAKYLNSPETPVFSKSRILYGLNLSRKNLKPGTPAIVVEGYLDAALIYQAGFETVVATLGTALSDAHVKQLKQLTDTIVLCFDGDDAGRKAADRAVEIALRSRMEVLVCVLSEGTDPAEFVVQRGREPFKNALQSAVPALEFKWSLMESSVRTGGANARREAVVEFVRFVGSVSGAGGVDPLEQGMLVGRLAALLGIPADSVYALLSTKRRTSRRDAPSTPDAQSLSAYDASIRGVPAVLVAVVEELFGCLIAEPACLSRIDDRFRRAVGHCGTWKRLLSLLEALHERFGDVSKADVVERIDDAITMECVDRALRRVASGESPSDAFVMASGRLSAELDALEMSEMRAQLRSARPNDEAGESAYVALISKARRQAANFAVERRASVLNDGA